MKQLTCEMCGSTELLKQDGVFVCQACGTKYSVEEAKKMMVEGTVEVQGVVRVANTAHLDNLLKLAHSAYESENYAKAEEFCDQIIAMDASCYEAWKLKGEAINYQISLSDDRITEVYNCIMTSYKVLDEAGKEKHREEILETLRDCLEGEITFVLEQFEEDRPSESLLMKVTTTFANCGANIIASYEELGYSKEETEAYKIYIRNFFIKGVNAACDSSWENVSYRYFRNGLTEEYRPDAETMLIYMAESQCLLSLLKFTEAMFDATTDPVDKNDNYLRQNIIYTNLLKAESYKRMVKTTTNGYGAVVNREEYWQLDRTPTEETKANWEKEQNRTYALSDKAEIEIVQRDPNEKEKIIRGYRDTIKSIKVNHANLGCSVGLGIGLFAIIGLPMLLLAVNPFTIIWAVTSLVVFTWMVLSIHRDDKKKDADGRAKIANLEKQIHDLENAALAGSENEKTTVDEEI